MFHILCPSAYRSGQTYAGKGQAAFAGLLPFEYCCENKKQGLNRESRLTATQATTSQRRFDGCRHFLADRRLGFWFFEIAAIIAFLRSHSYFMDSADKAL